MTLLALIAAKKAPPLIRPKALYIVPHQDDESLTTGGAILDDVQRGLDVYCLITSNGAGAGHRTSASLRDLLGYTPTPEQYMNARDREFTSAVTRMGARPIIAPYEDRQPDGSAQVGPTAEMVKKYAPFVDDAALRAHSTYDGHADHKNTGRALLALHAEGLGRDHRLCLSGRSVGAKQIDASWGVMGTHPSVTEWHTEAYFAKNINLEKGWWGCGEQSAGGWFDYTLGVDGRTYWHFPE